MARDEYATSLVQLRGSRSAREFSSAAVDVMRMEEGLIAEFWRCYDDFEAARTSSLRRSELAPRTL